MNAATNRALQWSSVISTSIDASVYISTAAMIRPTERGALYLAPGWGRRLGLDGPNVHWTCTTCTSTYPEMNGAIRCNGHTITRCPWCRSDSKPWTNGRGR